jgi:hypothetical protein
MRNNETNKEEFTFEGSPQFFSRARLKSSNIWNELEEAANLPQNANIREGVKQVVKQAEATQGTINNSRAWGVGRSGKGVEVHGALVTDPQVDKFHGASQALGVDQNGNIRNLKDTDWDTHKVTSDMDGTQMPWGGGYTAEGILKDLANTAASNPTEGRQSYVDLMVESEKNRAAMERRTPKTREQIITSLTARAQKDQHDEESGHNDWLRNTSQLSK